MFALAFCFLLVTVVFVREGLSIDDDDDDDVDVWFVGAFCVTARLVVGMVDMFFIMVCVGLIDECWLGGWAGSGDVVGPSPAVLEEYPFPKQPPWDLWSWAGGGSVAR